MFVAVDTRANALLHQGHSPLRPGTCFEDCDDEEKDVVYIYIFIYVHVHEYMCKHL